jgi:uncharacterized membrane protein YfcA
MYDWTPEFIVSICIAAVISALAMPTGLGGGVLYVPDLRLIGGMDQIEASAMSRVLITGGSVGSIIFQIVWQIRHPNEPLLAQPYYVTVIMPVFMSGSVIGVYLSNVLPSLICLTLLVVLSIISSVMTFKKGFECYKKENELIAAQQVARLIQLASPASTRRSDKQSDYEIPPLEPICSLQREISWMSLDAGINIETLGYDDAEKISIVSGSPMITATPPPIHRISSIQSLSSLRRYPPATRNTTTPSIAESIEEGVVVHAKHGIVKTHPVSRGLDMIIGSTRNFVIFVIIYWLVLIVLTISKGGPGRSSITGVEPCGPLYWGLVGFQVVSGIVFVLVLAYRELRLIMVSAGFGLVATIAGASGGMLLNPMLLYMGLDPQQVAATSTVILLVSSSSVSLEFAFTGKVQPILFTLMLTTLAGSVAGMTVLSWLVKKLGRQSFLVFLLGGLVVVGGVILVYIGTTDTISAYNAGENPFAFGQIC